MKPQAIPLPDLDAHSIVMCLAGFDSGLDTHELSQRLHLPESVVARALRIGREARMAAA